MKNNIYRIIDDLTEEYVPDNYDKIMSKITPKQTDEATGKIIPFKNKKISLYFSVAACIAICICTVTFMSLKNDPSEMPISSSGDYREEINSTSGSTTKQNSTTTKPYIEITGPYIEINEGAVFCINEIKQPPVFNYLFRGDGNLIPMTRAELCDYYGLDPADIVPENFTEKQTPQGFYKYDDVVDDMNRFLFESEDGSNSVSFTLTKNKEGYSFTEYANESDKEPSDINGFDVCVYRLNSGAEPVFYAEIKINDCNIVISAVNVTEKMFSELLEKLTLN